MRRAEKLLIIPFAAILLLFGAGLVRIFALRFRAGDVYPPYSSLRADPLGTKALYETLAQMPGLSAERNIERFDKLTARPGTTLIYAGLNPDQDYWYIDREIFRQLGALALDGARIVIAFTPVTDKSGFDPVFDRSKFKPPAPQKGGGLEDKLMPELHSWKELLEEWDVGMAFERVRLDRREGVIKPFEAAHSNGHADPDLPATLMIRTGIYFEPDDSGGWTTVYDIENRAVILERPFGDGGIVLMAEGFPLSNEALYSEREPGLLRWLAGSATRVVFDETHLGIQQDPGVMNLARKYGLHGALASLALLAVLFIWHSAVPVVPRHQEAEETEQAARADAKDAFSGMVNLLRRGIPANELIGTCVREWKRTLRAARPGVLARAPQVEAVALRATDEGRIRAAPAAAYREISGILNQRGGNP